MQPTSAVAADAYLGRLEVRAMRGEVTLDEANDAGVAAHLQLMEVIESQMDS